LSTGKGQCGKAPEGNALRYAVVGIGLVGAALRLVALGPVPPALHFDEAVYGLMARQIGPGYWPVFFPAYTGREPLYMYLMAGVFHLLGSSAVTVRLTSALIGIATMPALYWLARELYGRRVALVSVAIMAGNYWHLSLSRNGYPNILIPPLECLALALLWRGYRDRRPLLMGAGGLFIGLVLYTYLAARLFPVTLVLYFLYVLLVDARRFWQRAGGLALAVLAALAVFAPLGVYFYQHPHDFYERASQVLVFESGGGWGSWLRTMASNLLQNLGGLFIRGDPRPLFNLPGKPVFTPVMAAFLLLGTGIAARRIKRPEYGLLPIWVLGMCLPAVLTDDLMPQSQRMSGIVPAVYMLVALGLVGAWSWLLQRLPTRDALLRGLVIALLVAETGGAAHAYFGIWARMPMNFYHFHAPYALLAQDIAEHLAPEDTAVVISEHYRHPTAVFENPATRDAIWLVQHNTLVLPSRASGDVLIYWPHHPLISQPYIAERLPGLVEPVRRVLDPAGGVALDVYRLLREAAEVAGRQPALAATGELEVLGWTVPGQARRDQELEVEVIWRVRSETTQGRLVSVHLVDAAGRLWSEHTDLGFMPEQWRTGDTVYQRFLLPLPEGIPAGAYRAVFVLANDQAEPFPVTVQDKNVGFAVELGAVELTPEGAHIEPPREGPLLGGTLRLVDAPQLEGAIQSPQLELHLTWQAARAPSTDYQVTFHLSNEGGEVWSQRMPLAGTFGTSAWQVGEIVQAWYALELPDLPAGRYGLSLQVPGLEGSIDLGTVTVHQSLHTYTVPPMGFHVGAQFASSVELLGYDLQTLQRGSTLKLTLYWRAMSAPQGDAKVFIHIVGPDGVIRAQADAVPLQWQRPTSGWLPGEVLSDPYELTIPVEAPAGEYRIYVGLYDPMTLERWPVRTGDGQVVADGRLPLATLPVGP